MFGLAQCLALNRTQDRFLPVPVLLRDFALIGEPVAVEATEELFRIVAGMRHSTADCARWTRLTEKSCVIERIILSEPFKKFGMGRFLSMLVPKFMQNVQWVGRELGKTSTTSTKQRHKALLWRLAVLQ